tara:strand:+ start:26 stop:400 length:375 start_codon:yes stop_codon:yes gene_type:complete
MIKKTLNEKIIESGKPLTQYQYFLFKKRQRKEMEKKLKIKFGENFVHIEIDDVITRVFEVRKFTNKFKEKYITYTNTNYRFDEMINWLDRSKPNFQVIYKTITTFSKFPTKDQIKEIINNKVVQ